MTVRVITLAGVPGIEPGTSVLETGMLPITPYSCIKLWYRRRDLNSHQMRFKCIVSANCTTSVFQKSVLSTAFRRQQFSRSRLKAVLKTRKTFWRSLQESNLCRWVCNPPPISTRPNDLESSQWESSQFAVNTVRSILTVNFFAANCELSHCELHFGTAGRS